MRTTLTTAALCSTAALCLMNGSATAETVVGFRQLGSTTPVAVQRGTKQVLAIRSNLTLDGAYAVFFDRPGIQAKFLETKPIEAPLRGRGQTGEPFRFEFDVPADQPLGVYECRVATRTAVSSVTHILVTDFPVVQEESKNNDTRAAAQPVSVPVAICGTCDRPEDVDYYKFEGTAGQELTFNVSAQRVTEAVHSMQSGNGAYLMDAILTLYAPNGQVLAQNDNFFGGDPFLAVMLPQDGTYLVEVRDTRYIGNPKYVYCLEIAEKPFVHAVFPMAVQQGTSTEVELVGPILGRAETTRLHAAADEPAGWKERVIETPRGESNPVPVLVSEFPQVIASGANNTFETALSLTLPIGVNGRFLEPLQQHVYSFQAEKGRYYLFEVEAQRRGLPLDSFLEIHDADGKKLAEADDGLQTKDSQLYFQAPADGTFYITIRDLLARGGNRFFYHLRAEPSGPDFEVHGEYYYALIAPGTRMMWFARVNRLNGFNGPVEINVEGLPEGVTFTPLTIPPEVNHGALILSAASDAPIGASLVRVFGKAHIPDHLSSMDFDPGEENATELREVIRYGRVTCELQSQGGGQGRWPIKTQLVGVTDPLDLLNVEATPTEITLKPGEKAEIKFRVERNESFNDPLTMAMSFDYFTTVFGAQLPPGVTMAPGSTTLLNKNATEGKIILQAGTGANKPPPVERLPIAVLARVSISFSITTNYASNPIYLTVPDEE